MTLEIFKTNVYSPFNPEIKTVKGNLFKAGYLVSKCLFKFSTLLASVEHNYLNLKAHIS